MRVPKLWGKTIKQPGPAKHWTCWYHLKLKSPRSELPPQECCGLSGGVNPGFIKLWHWKIPYKSMEVLMAKFIYKWGIFQQAMFDCRRVVCLNESRCANPGMTFAQYHCLSIPPTCFFPPHLASEIEQMKYYTWTSRVYLILFDIDVFNPVIKHPSNQPLGASLNHHQYSRTNNKSGSWMVLLVLF